MIRLKSSLELEAIARAGEIVAAAIAAVSDLARPEVSTAELDSAAEELIRGHAGAEPAFKGLYGFPATLCTSINDEVVHGIPSDRCRLRAGDILSVDVGVQLDGFFADAAVTVPIGEVSSEMERLLEVTRESLGVGIAQATVGKRIGDIGSAIQDRVEEAGYSVIRELVGHGVGEAAHEDPQVPNYGRPSRGPVLEEGLVIAIEPMVNLGGPAIRTLSDGWTVVTADGSVSAHFEHTVAITTEGPRIMTQAPVRTPAGER